MATRAAPATKSPAAIHVNSLVSCWGCTSSRTGSSPVRTWRDHAIRAGCQTADMDRDVLVVGESLVDIVATLSGAPHEYAGGSAANVAVALSRLGRPVRLATSFAADPHGEMIATHLDQAGVTLACDPGAVERTSTAMATIGTAGAARYTFDIDWRLSPVPDEPAPAGRAHLLAGRGARRRGGRRARPARAAAGPRDHHLRRQRAARGDRDRPRGGRPGRADGRRRRPGQGQRRGPRGALPGPVHDRLGGRAPGRWDRLRWSSPEAATARSGWTARDRSRSRRGR